VVGFVSRIGACVQVRHVRSPQLTERYLLPPLVFLPLLPLSALRLNVPAPKSSPPGGGSNQPNTQETLLHTLSDLHAIHARLPPSPLPTFEIIYARFRQLGPVRLTRGLVVLWCTWLVLGRLVGYRALLALLGTVLFLLPSPPLAHLYNLLSKSLAVRRAIVLAFLFTFGSPPEQSFTLGSWSLRKWFQIKWAASRRPSLTFSFRPKMGKEASVFSDSAVEDEDEEKAGDPISFRFEVHENQRWWMGLDWTSALLPQERPSWCDSHLLPVPPPPSYTLPAPSSIVLPTPTKGDPNATVRRTATWRWLDDDWSIVRAGPGNANASPSMPPQASGTLTGGTVSDTAEGFAVGHSPPKSFTSSFGTSPEDTVSPTSRAQWIAEQAFTKGLGRLKARTATSPVSTTKLASPRASVEIQRGGAGSHVSEEAPEDGGGGSSLSIAGGAAGGLGVATPVETIVERDEATDQDGWVYGDNKWEGMGPKGGLGKAGCPHVLPGSWD
jgi:hypothetical protein